MKRFVSRDAVSFWNERAEDWENRIESDAFYADRARLAADLVGKYGGRSVLDVGCATGTLTRILLDRSYDAYGYDVAAAMIEIAIDHGAEPRRFLSAPGGRIPFRRRFETIVAMGVFPYVASHRAFALHLCEHLEPGGRLIASSTNRLSLYTLRLLASHLRQLRGGAEWRAVAWNLVTTGVWSGGFVEPQARKHCTNARQFDAMMAAIGLEQLEAVDLYNIAWLDRAPMLRGQLAARIARRVAWTHIGVWRAPQSR